MPYTYPFNAGGGKNALSFAKKLNEKNCNTSLLSLNLNMKLPSKSIISTVPIRRIPYFNYNIITKVLSLIFIIPYYKFFILKSDIILIYSSDNILNDTIILFSKLFGKKVIFRSTMLKDDDIFTLINSKKILKTFRKKIFSMIDGYFSLSPKFTESYLKIYNTQNKIFESSQGVDSSLFFPVSNAEKINIRRKLNIDKDKIVLISVGYLIMRKGFIEIADILSKIDLPFIYIIVGDYKIDDSHYLSYKKEEMDSVYMYCKHKLGNKVLFTGSKENVNEYLQASDIYIMNSKKEGLPNAMLEAMASGTAVVSNNLAGLRDFILIDDVNSLIFNNADEMHKLIELLIKNENLRQIITSNAHDFIAKNCSIDKIAQEFIKFIKL